MHLQVVVVELGQGVTLVGGLRCDVFVYAWGHAALGLEAAGVYRLLGLSARGDAEF